MKFENQESWNKSHRLFATGKSPIFWSFTCHDMSTSAPVSKPRRNPPRASRSTRPLNTPDDWFPELKDSETRSGDDHSVNRQINILNKEAYPSHLFSKADNLLVYSFFVKKGRKKRHHAVDPQPAQPEKRTALNAEDGTSAANLCRTIFNGSEFTWEDVKAVVKDMQTIPMFKVDEEEGPNWSACLKQWVLYSLPGVTTTVC